VARLLFGVSFGRLGADDYYFDITTFMLLRQALRVVNPGTRVVDLGTGTQAVIGLALWKKIGCPVIAVDVNPAIVELAQSNVARNSAPVAVRESSFFDGVPDVFDLVVFNPPYISTDEGESQGLPAARRTQWDGGASGTQVVEEFLSACAARGHSFRILLGVNSMHVGRDRIVRIIESHARITVIECHRSWLLPVVIYECTVTGNSPSAGPRFPTPAW
jgi:methylase of polypeptide subunit release factors